MGEQFAKKKLFDVIGILLLAVCVLLVSSIFLWTGHLNTSGLGASLNDQPGYIVTARNIAEHGRFESTIYYPAKVPYYKSHNVPYMPGNYYIRAFFFHLFGHSLLVSFLPNLLAFVGSSVLLFLIAGRIFDRTTAYLATVLFMLFPPLTLYAFSAMMENIFIFACLISFYLFIRMPEKTRYILGVLTLLPAVLIRETAIFMIFGYAAMIFFSDDRKSPWKSIIFLTISLAAVFLIFQFPPMSDRPPTFYARLINAPSLHYTDAYALQNISFTASDTIKLIWAHLIQNVSYMVEMVISLEWGMGFVFFICLIALFVLTLILAVRGLIGNRQFASFAIVTTFTELLAIFLFYDYFGYTGARLMLFMLPFFLCTVIASILSSSSLRQDDAIRIVLGVTVVSAAIFFFVCLSSFSRDYAVADEYDRHCNEFLRAVGASEVNFFAAPFHISLDYVNEGYPVKWSFLPDNERTLRLLVSKYPVELLVVPSMHPLVFAGAGNIGKKDLLEGKFREVDEKTFNGETYKIFRAEGSLAK